MKSIFCTVLLAAASLIAIAAPLAPRGPSTKSELLELLSQKAPSTVITRIVQRDGITFEPSEPVLDEFRKAGANDAVIAAMRVSWHPECPAPLSDKDILVLAAHVPSNTIVNMVQKCGIGFQPTAGYFNELWWSGVKDELVRALRTSATKPFTKGQLLQLSASGEDAGQIGKGIQERGIDFDPSEDDLSRLRAVGASESLLQAIRDAKRVEPALKQLPSLSDPMSPGLTGVNGAGGLTEARANCSPSVSAIPVFSSPSDMPTVAAHLECGDRITILEKDSGRIGIDKVLIAGLTDGFVQDFCLRSDYVSPPFPTYNPEPPYTPKARHHKIQGTVTLMIVVNAQGNVTEAREVANALGDGLDQEAIETIKTWKFKPAIRGGVPVPVRVTVELTFRLFDRKTPR